MCIIGIYTISGGAMERYYKAIDTRFSVNRFKSSLSAREKESLQRFADSLSAQGVRIVIASNPRVFPKSLFQRGITGTDCFAAIISENGRSLYTGYIGEYFILECTARGIGTHWLGNSFKMNAALEVIDLNPGESIAAVTPLGISDEPFTRSSRKSIHVLTGIPAKEYQNLPDWQRCAVECARRAPSAMNKQPWEIDVNDDGRSIGIANISKNFGFGELDCGIAMLHAEIGAAHHKVHGIWDLSQDDVALFVVQDGEYPDAEPYDDGSDELYVGDVFIDPVFPDDEDDSWEEADERNALDDFFDFIDEDND